MTKALRWMLIGLLVAAGSLGGVAAADVEDSAAGSNAQEGDNESEAEQSGAAASGDAVAGQVTGVVSAGDTSVDATNRSEDVDIETGDATGANDAAQFVGLNDSDTVDIDTADIDNVAAGANLQEGDNEFDVSQAASAASGDGVGGQVIGVVTSAGGSADIVASNTSEDVDIDTGDAEAYNDVVAFVGLNESDSVDLGTGGQTTTAADITNSAAGFNVQEGDNDLSGSQEAAAASGDGVGGQVIGVVSAGDTSIDATNRSEDVDIDTGDVVAENDVAAFVGLNRSDTLDLGTGGQTTTAADIDGVAAGRNLQEGDNSKDFAQSANASSGDAVGGQVAGVVTSAGGSADLVLANTSEDADAETGESEFDNEDVAFVGLNFSNTIDI